MTVTVTAVIPTVTFLVLASAAAITGLMLWRLRGKVQSHPGDTWWQIRYDSITLLPQHKVRPHTLSSWLDKGPPLGTSTVRTVASHRWSEQPSHFLFLPQQPIPPRATPSSLLDFVTGLLLCRSCAVNRSICEFTSRVHLCIRSSLTRFQPAYHAVPWASGHIYSICGQNSASNYLEITGTPLKLPSTLWGCSNVKDSPQGHPVLFKTTLTL
jgi:hypothetical protein